MIRWRGEEVVFESMDQCSDEAEDWFMDSLHMYKDLHVFQLEHPTKVIEWTSEKSICVAGYSSPKNEILELLLPLKLYAGGKQGLCPERDFKVEHGGFSEEPVECLRHIFGKRCLVSSGRNSSKLQVWDIGGDDTDIIRRTGVLNLSDSSPKSRKIASGLTEDPSVLHGYQISNVQLTELASGKVIYSIGSDSVDAVSGLQFVNASAFVVCGNNGSLYLGDTRDPKIECFALQETTSRSDWTFGLRSGQPESDSSSCTVARLSSSGQVFVSDLRKMSTPVRRAQINVQHGDASSEFLTVTWAPALDNALAVSGFDGSVLVFDTTSWTTESQTPEPIFVHRGHIMSCEMETDDSPVMVTTHAWHPWRPRTLLSAASDGSMHVWDWVDKNNETL
ncbi:WD repeat-containing protein 73 [Astyanax mexicanus]|uniref:WD repeat-containing protein 73 n=1 Tax=Astyanax mexicanus TaxID=7994 RepID=UPI0020CAEF31|nr:WD repeat-containing protein 73 [Astyanax mexicanus]